MLGYGCKQLSPRPLNPIPAYGPFERWDWILLAHFLVPHMESITYWLLRIMQLDGQKQKLLSTTKQQQWHHFSRSLYVPDLDALWKSLQMGRGLLGMT